MLDPKFISLTREDAEAFCKRKYVDLLRWAAILFIASLCPTALTAAGVVCGIAGLTGAYLCARGASRKGDQHGGPVILDADGPIHPLRNS